MSIYSESGTALSLLRPHQDGTNQGKGQRQMDLCGLKENRDLEGMQAGKYGSVGGRPKVIEK